MTASVSWALVKPWVGSSSLQRSHGHHLDQLHRFCVQISCGGCVVDRLSKDPIFKSLLSFVTKLQSLLLVYGIFLLLINGQSYYTSIINALFADKNPHAFQLSFGQHFENFPFSRMLRLACFKTETAALEGWPCGQMMRDLNPIQLSACHSLVGERKWEWPHCECREPLHVPSKPINRAGLERRVCRKPWEKIETVFTNEPTDTVTHAPQNNSL